MWGGCEAREQMLLSHYYIHTPRFTNYIGAQCHGNANYENELSAGSKGHAWMGFGEGTVGDILLYRHLYILYVHL